MVKVQKPGNQEGSSTVRFVLTTICFVALATVLFHVHKNNNITEEVDVCDPSLPTWFDKVAGDGHLTCDEVFTKVRVGEWKDPNKGQMFVRQVKTLPQFFVSLHDQSYDRVRWGSIWVNGKNYEDKVRKHFEHILKSSQPPLLPDGMKYEGPEDKVAPLVIDIGGNIGYYTLLSMAWGHSVLTFEINPVNLVRLCESLHVNWPNSAYSPVSNPYAAPAPHAKFYQRAVSNIDDRHMEVVIPSNPGGASIQNVGSGFNASAITHTEYSSVTSTITLDAFAEERGWFERSDVVIRVLKIDTEGHEPQIIQGGKKLLGTGKVKNLLTELRLLQPECQEAVEFLFETGYTIVIQTDDDVRKLTIAESMKYIEDKAKAMGGRTTWYQDLWFQLVSEE